MGPRAHGPLAVLQAAAAGVSIYRRLGFVNFGEITEYKPAELESRFKFARQKSKLAGTIRGSYFVIKNEY